MLRRPMRLRVQVNSFGAVVIWTYLYSYIQKVIMSADFSFQSKKSEKVRKFARQNFATKVRKSKKFNICFTKKRAYVF